MKVNLRLELQDGVCFLTADLLLSWFFYIPATIETIYPGMEGFAFLISRATVCTFGVNITI